MILIRINIIILNQSLPIRQTMKKILVLMAYFICLISYAQEGSVGIGTQTPNEKAVLHLVAPQNDQGFLVPKMTTAQITSFGASLTADENGMLVYDTDVNQFFFWLSDHWEEVGSSLQAGSGVDITNGVITNSGDADADPENELKDLTISGDVLTITGLTAPTSIDLSPYAGTNTDEQDLQFTSGQILLTGDPDNTIIDLSGYDADVSDDFSGSWLDLTDLPTGFDDDVDDVDDADADATNEIQDISTDNSPGNISLTNGSTINLNVDDADNDPTNEIELPSTAITGEVLKYDGSGWGVGADLVDDGDTDATNELQDLNLESNILTITGLVSPTTINLAPYAGTNTDEQNLQFLDGVLTLTGDPDGIGADLSGYDTDVSDDFSGSWTDLTNLPEGFDDDVDDVNDADADPTNEIEFPTTASTGYVMKYNGAAWVASPDDDSDGDTSSSNEIELPSGEDGEANKYREYQEGNYLKANNFISTPISVSSSMIGDGILGFDEHKFFKTILVTPDVDKGSTIAEIDIGQKDIGVSGQEIIIINVGTGSLSFSNEPSNSNLYLPDGGVSIGTGGSIHFIYVYEEKGFNGWVLLSYISNVGR